MLLGFAVSEFDKARYMGLCLRYKNQKAGVKIEKFNHYLDDNNHIGNGS